MLRDGCNEVRFAKLGCQLSIRWSDAITETATNYDCATPNS